MNMAFCRQCGEVFSYEESDTIWFEWKFYSEKTISCPHCKFVNVLKYEDQLGLNVNEDKRFYDYRRKWK